MAAQTQKLLSLSFIFSCMIIATIAVSCPSYLRERDVYKPYDQTHRYNERAIIYDDFDDLDDLDEYDVVYPVYPDDDLDEYDVVYPVYPDDEYDVVYPVYPDDDFFDDDLLVYPDDELLVYPDDDYLDDDDILVLRDEYGGSGIRGYGGYGGYGAMKKNIFSSANAVIGTIILRPFKVN
ncbi:4584_t:CDS:2 [Ambispora leptoticha]|uniref:4584_t:CDS:1 n=2 Tax=Glomeromycetes TaxID=214506 RepID=A0A9N8Z4S0_9GLOM|nr:4584_t:CDS:2 [Ambispora leptoticha]